MGTFDAIGAALDEGNRDEAVRLWAELKDTASRIRTTMTVERAREIRDSRAYLDSMPREDADEIRRVWNDLPGWTCFADVLKLIIAGKVAQAAL